MSWFSPKTLGALIVGGPLLAQASVQHDAQKEQTQALRDMRDQDARNAAEAETGAAVAANAQIADSKRRRRSSALGLGGDTAADGLGAPSSALAGGASAASQALAAYYGGGVSYSGTALGAGASSTTAAPRVSTGGRTPGTSKLN